VVQSVVTGSLGPGFRVSGQLTTSQVSALLGLSVSVHVTRERDVPAAGGAAPGHGQVRCGLTRQMRL